ncbi:MAG: hypothetical protein IJ551_00125 [Prevotella sp.]|nr:hypothetical protein [Prevotella sp.]
MKKTKFFAYAGAIALVSIGFTSCSSEDEVANVNPTFDGDAVKTQFTISMPGNVANGTTRMTGDIVQQAQTIAAFRGMDNIVLIPFAKQSALTGTEEKLGDPITLSSMVIPEVATVSNYIPDGKLLENNNAVLYNDVTVPVGTGSFLFYGKAKDNAFNTAITSEADMFKFGTLAVTGIAGTTPSYQPADITFAHVAINDGTVNQVATDLVAMLNNIVAAKVGTKAWYQYTADDNAGLKELFDNYVTLTAGSSANVQATVQDLYSALYKNTDDMSKAICTAITTTSGNTAATDGTLTFATKYDGYPANIYLPDGAAAVAYNATSHQFAVANASVDGMEVPARTDYVYPANLYYRANSTIKVANASKKDQYVTTNDWAAILAKYTDGNSVTTTTRSVAINDPIQYAVGRLDMTVKVDNVDKLDDSVEEKDADGDVKVDVPTAGFPVSAILIGGQEEVDWQFLPATAKGTNTQYTIYDKVTGVNAKKNTADGTNYTLALETRANEPVSVAIELTNNTGKDFFGINGKVIPSGCKFYLVASLDPTKTAEIGANPDNINQVFKQDYVTTVNFTIKDLKKAYNVIPDLRSPELELGLSVDLNWKSGITFNINL